VRTLVGYAGGTRRSPTYRSLGDHTETLRVEYDPARVSYEELLRVFWESHDPRQRTWSTQYKAAVFVHDEGQRRLAERTREQIARRLGAAVHTEILPAGPFTPAEDYHQKYYLRADRVLAGELLAIYPDPADFAGSTAAARLNGYLGGNGSLEQLRGEIDGLGLSLRARERLLEIVSARRR